MKFDIALSIFILPEVVSAGSSSSWRSTIHNFWEAPQTGDRYRHRKFSSSGQEGFLYDCCSLGRIYLIQSVFRHVINPKLRVDGSQTKQKERERGNIPGTVRFIGAVKDDKVDKQLVRSVYWPLSLSEWALNSIRQLQIVLEVDPMWVN